VAWGRTSPAERGVVLNKIADRMEANLAMLAAAETWDNGKPLRETTYADLPLAIDHFRYFAGCVRAQEGSISEIDATHLRLPLPRAARRGRPDHPWNFPLPDGGVEARSRAGRRQLRGAEAGRADARRRSWC
jgi:aldehyde dehydrogenase